MFDMLFQKRSAIQHHLKAPLLQERLMYLQYQSDNGATKKTIIHYSYYLLNIIKYLKLEAKNEITLLEIHKAAERWATRPRRTIQGFSKRALINFKSIAKAWLSMLGRLNYPVNMPSPFFSLTELYIDYMRLERGLSETTIYVRSRILKDFFSCIGKKSQIQNLTILDIDNILENKRNVKGYKKSGLKSYASTIRAFLTFAEGRRLCSSGLAKLIKIPRVYEMESLPSIPSTDEIHELLNIDNKSPTSIRDKAILMLLAIYGLRSGEIVKMRLEDLDWKNEILNIRRTKNSKPQKFPLSRQVGNAILLYLQKVRPKNCLYREVFITRKAPYHPLRTSSAIGAIVRNRWKSLNIVRIRNGPHSLRHACAVHLLSDGITLKEIGDYLGHQNIESTRIYAKVDLINLRKVANFEIGDLL